MVEEIVLVVYDVPVAKEEPPVARLYQLMVPALEAAALNTTAPEAPQTEPGVVDVILDNGGVVTGVK